MLDISDPIRLVGRSVTVRTADGDEQSGTLCSAGLSGVVVDVDGHSEWLAAADIDSVEAANLDDAQPESVTPTS
ncbi:MAG: hypothetical protein R2710_03070 [Acidimicrobiales bacterium]